MFMTVRWFARAYAYAIHQQPAAFRSDVAYSVFLLLTLFMAFIAERGRLSIEWCSFALFLSALGSLLTFGPGYILNQFALSIGPLFQGYRTIWDQHTKWATIGVLSTELTVNAHSYLITAFLGPAAFAPIAAASLLTRPVAICFNAITELERPAAARAIGRQQHRTLQSIRRNILSASLSSWLINALLAAALIAYVPGMLARQGYQFSEIAWAAFLWFLIMAVRALRVGPSLVLQCSGKFKPLASASIVSSGVSIVGAGILLLAFGPVASLIGILVGDVVLGTMIAARAKGESLLLLPAREAP